MHSSLHQMRLGMHHVLEEEPIQLLLFQFLKNLAADFPCNGRVFAIIYPELVNIAALFPVISLILIVGMRSILCCDVRKVVRQLWIQRVMGEERVQPYTYPKQITEPRPVCIEPSVLCYNPV